MARILVIEDDAHWRLVVTTRLTQAGFEVEEAENGLDGLRAYRARPADVVITDIMMPEHDGMEIVKTLKEESADIKIVAMSAGSPDFDWSSPENLLETAKFLHVDRALQKPFSKEALYQAVRELLV